MGINHVSQQEVSDAAAYLAFARDAGKDQDRQYESHSGDRVEGSTGAKSGLSRESGKAKKSSKADNPGKDPDGAAGPACRVDFSPAGHIASHYDLTSITRKEVGVLAEELLDGGLISFDTYNSLSFEPRLTEDHNQLIAPFVSESDVAEPFDLLASLKETLRVQEEAQASETAIFRTRSLLNLMTNLNYMGNLGL
ncbi:MAG: hypothetical protein ACLFVY_04360 [Phycisphaerae bacterium]